MSLMSYSERTKRSGQPGKSEKFNKLALGKKKSLRLTVVELMPRLLSASDTIVFLLSTYSCSPAHRDVH